MNDSSNATQWVIIADDSAVHIQTNPTSVKAVAELAQKRFRRRGKNNQVIDMDVDVMPFCGAHFLPWMRWQC